jgi:hypothetical protein
MEWKAAPETTEMTLTPLARKRKVLSTTMKAVLRGWGMKANATGNVSLAAIGIVFLAIVLVWQGISLYRIKGSYGTLQGDFRLLLVRKQPLGEGRESMLGGYMVFPTSIRDHDDGVLAVMRTNGLVEGLGEVFSSEKLIYFNCKRREFTVLKMTTVYSAKEESRHNESVDQKAVVVSPGSPVDIARGYACEPAWRRYVIDKFEL